MLEKFTFPDAIIPYFLSAMICGADSVEQEPGKTFSTSKSKVLKILTYNVWFADIEMNKRMKAIGNLISLHKPDVICFQVIIIYISTRQFARKIMPCMKFIDSVICDTYSGGYSRNI